jgi:hypothetical protein
MALLLGVLASALLAGGCGGGPTSVRTPPAPSAQQLFKVRLLADDRSLDRGVLSYQVPATMATGGSATLNVQVTDIGNAANGTAPMPTGTGWVFVPRDVPTGGIVGVQAFCDGLSCGALAPERQSVLSYGKAANWSWQLSAQNPGIARILLVATTYDQNTNIALNVSQPVEITVTVTATSGYWLTKTANWVKALIGLVGVGVIITAVQALWRWQRKRKKTGAHEKQVPPEPAGRP